MQIIIWWCSILMMRWQVVSFYLSTVSSLLLTPQVQLPSLMEFLWENVHKMFPNKLKGFWFWLGTFPDNSSNLTFSPLLCTRGRYLVALGRYYHPEEFTCSQCRKVLDEGGFFEEKGSIFCPKCYDMRYAPNCAKCKKKITGVSSVGASE